MSSRSVILPLYYPAYRVKDLACSGIEGLIEIRECICDVKPFLFDVSVWREYAADKDGCLPDSGLIQTLQIQHHYLNGQIR